MARIPTAPVSSRPAWQEPTPLAVQVLKAVVIAAIVIVMVFPFINVIAQSFAAPGASTSGLLPSAFSTAAYESLFSGGVVTRAMLVSIGITVVGTVLSMFFTLLLAYGFTRTSEVPGAKAMFVLVLATMLFGAGIIPNYLLIKELGLLNTYASQILPVLISAFNMVVLRNFMMNLPQELLDAARIDGANEWQVLWRVVVPMSRAVIAVIALFYAVGYWNSFFNALLYIDGTSKWPIQLVLNSYVLQGSPLAQISNPNQTPPPVAIQMAVVVLATLPILILYPFLQRYFTKGVLTGAIKG